MSAASQLASWRRTLDRKLADLDHAGRQVRDERHNVRDAKRLNRSCAEAQAFVQEIAAGVQENAHKQVAGVVTRCLRAVFGEEESYDFAIRFERKRGKTEAELLFVRDGHAIDPVDAAGGGTVDVAAFALRLACLVLARPKRRRLLVLDEPFRFLSAEYVPKIRVLLEMLTKELGVQILLVTHNENLQVGKVIALS